MKGEILYLNRSYGARKYNNLNERLTGRAQQYI